MDSGLLDQAKAIFACHLDRQDSGQPTNSQSDSWRRTVHGWEQVSAWSEAQLDSQAWGNLATIHPALVAALLLLALTGAPAALASTLSTAAN